METPKTKIVVTDDPSSLRKYECANCDFASDDYTETEKHMEEFKHEMWVARGR